MASFRIVPKEHWDILTEYLDDSINVLISEDAVAELSPEQQEKLKNNIDMGLLSDYNCGGDADHWVDLVLSKDNYAMSYALDPEGEEEI